MDNDDLLTYAWRLNAELSRQRDAAAEPRQTSGAYIPPEEIREAARREARIAARRGLNTVDEIRAGRERVLIAYLKRREDNTPHDWYSDRPLNPYSF